MSSLANLWREAFENWPPAFRRKGVLIPIGGEAIPFSDFLMTPTILVLERPTPDNVGARRVAIPFERIDTLKYTEPLRTEQFMEAGFSKGRTEPAAKPTRIAPVPVAPVPVGQQAAPQQMQQQQAAQYQQQQPQQVQQQPQTAMFAEQQQPQAYPPASTQQ